MSNDSQYQGSQAFNQYISSIESVNPNTGTLTLTKPLISLSGINNSIGLNLNLIYSPGSAGILGLPQNWIFDISYVMPNASLTSQGRNYILDPNWSDSTGYQSGLRYVNDNGIKFDTIIPPEPLPSDQGDYAYRMQYSDGSHDYFDITGKLIAHDDRFGNYIFYNYTDPQSGVVGNYLNTAVDSYGQITSFSYGANAIIITLPNGAQTTINYSSNGVENIEDALQNTTIFGYDPTGTGNMLNITYPTGLVTQLTYTSISFTNEAGATGSFPSVSSLQHLDSINNNAILEWMQYGYGTEMPGYTFTGYAAGLTLSQLSDNLMDSNDVHYQYEVLTEKLDTNGKLLTATRSYYNSLHVPLQIKQYSITDAGYTTDGYQTAYTYPMSENDARTTNYNKPLTVTSSVWSAEKNAYVPLNNTTNSYDNFGNVLTSQISLYDNNQNLIPQLNNTYTYIVATWGGAMPQSSTSQDLTSGGSLRKTDYVLTTPDQKNIESQSVKENGNPWKTASYTYDTNGRILSSTLAWSEGSNPDPDSISSTASQNSYNYDSSIHQLTVINTDALGNKRTTIYDVSLPGASLLKSTSPTGVVASYEYDVLGRLTKQTDPLGNVSSVAYSLASTNAVNTITAINPIGYTQVTYYDALGRSIKATDNGDPTNSTATRVLGQTVYNPAGQISQSTGRLGLISVFNYDGFGRQIQSTDTLSNTSITTYDDANLKISNTLNGVTHTSTQLDGFGRTLITEIYPNPSDTHINYYVQQSAMYNGFGQATKRNVNQISGQVTTQLNQTTWSYDADNNVITHQKIGYDSTYQVTTAKNSAYDLSGQVLHSSKAVTYAGNSPLTINSDKSKFDAIGNLIAKTNALSKTQTFTYHTDGVLQTVRHFDGTIITYDYDSNGNIIKQSWVENGTNYSINYTYDNDGSVKSVSDGVSTINYTYYLDGTLKVVTYPHGTQSYTLDQYSRMISEQDASSAMTNYTYKNNGLLNSVQQSGDMLTYTYETVNNRNGTLIGTNLSGHNAWTYSYKYDGWGFVNTSTVIDKNNANKILLSNSCSYDVLGRLTNLTKSSQTNTKKNVNLSKSYVFDGINQLMSATTTYSDGSPTQTEIFTYDGNNNVLSHTVNGTTTQLSYNAIDQLVGDGIQYDINGRMTSDGSGSTYRYNQLDQITTVMNSSGTTLLNYAYYPDGLLSSRTENANTQQFYYDNETVNAVTSSSGSNQTWATFLSNGNERVASYEHNQDPTYYLTSKGSTAQTVKGATNNSMDYDAYGAPNSPSSSLDANKNFTWNQEYMDPTSGLVYLRSRFYNPKLMRFMSMDTYPLYNKYAFGNGDPINMVDPTGHWSWDAFAGAYISIGEIMAGVIITVGTGGAGSAIGGGALMGAGISGLVYSAQAGINDNYDWRQFGIQQAAGAAGGAIAGAGGFAAASIGTATGSLAVAVTAGAAIGAGTGMAGQVASNAIVGNDLDDGLLQAGLVGGAMGGLTGGLGWRARFETTETIDLGTITRRTGPNNAIAINIDEGTTNLQALDNNNLTANNLRDFWSVRQQGVDVVIGHGNSGGSIGRMGAEAEQRITMNTLVRTMKNAGMGQRPIKLIMCNGSTIAQKLANKMNQTVFAVRGTVNWGNWGVAFPARGRAFTPSYSWF